MVTKEQLESAIKVNTYTPLDRGIMVLAPKIKERTDAGIIKTPAMIKEEMENTDLCLVVVAVHPQCTNVAPGDTVIPKVAIMELPMISCPIDGYGYAQVPEHNLIGVIKNSDDPYVVNLIEQLAK